MLYKPAYLAAVLIASSTLSFSAKPADKATASEGCSELRKLARTELVLSKTELVAAGPVAVSFGGASPMSVSVPEHCIVRGTLRPRTGVGGQSFGIGFELRLPTDWNGRFLFQGGGGLDGVVQPAIGLGSTNESALSRGFAVVSMDAGHHGQDASFASDQQARLDYAYVALGEMTEVAKAITEHYYGRAPRYSYFVGCSNGGRQGMMAAERYPYLFDGIVAGDPGFRLSRAALGEVWDDVQFSRIAPKDEAGKPILSRAFSDGDLQLISQRLLAECDGKDGLADGMINNIQACRFDPAVLACTDGKSEKCLSKPQVATLKAIFGGAHDSKGHLLYSSWPYDAGISAPGWRQWKMGTSATAQANGLNSTLGHDSLARYFSTPPLGAFDEMAFDFDKAEGLVADVGAINDATSPFLTSFKNRGAKLLVYHGLGDPVFSANDTISWFGRLTEVMGPTQDFARLFLVPGMNHCGGGPATDHFDALSAVQTWVEEGHAPDRLIASQLRTPAVAPDAAVVLTRPLCAFPKYAQYTGGDPSAAGSFECREPAALESGAARR